MLDIFHSSSNLSISLENYLSPSVSLTLTAASPIEIGYYKPISDLFIALKRTDLGSPTISFKLQCYTGVWTDLQAVDFTYGLTKSGFLSWDRTSITPKEILLNGKTQYWYRISVTADTPAIDFNGINLVFSSDLDLKEEVPRIMDYLPEGREDFLGFHQAARNDILTKFKSKFKNNDKKGPKAIDQFDLLEKDEVRQASKMLALSKIFMDLSDAVDDKWHQKAKEFEGKYEKAIDLSFLTVDTDDDGVADPVEKKQIQFIEVVRV